jgi:hypothetical protein
MAVSFGKDIKPMFRDVDISHMKKYGVKLDDFKYMSDLANNHKNAQDVQDKLTDQSMPPGGPYWTKAQLDLYAKWRSDGYQE